jgi:hypothetical protein
MNRHRLGASVTRIVVLVTLVLVTLAVAVPSPAASREGNTAGRLVPGAGAPAAQAPVPFTLDGQFGGSTFAVAASGDLLYAGVGPRVVVIDVSDPTAPRELGRSAPLPGVVVDLAVDGDTVYAIAGGLAVVDAGDPTAPAEIGFLALGEIDPVYGWVGPADIAVAEGVAYLTGNTDYGYGRLNLVDVSDPSDPRLASRLEVYTTVGVAAVGTTAYVSLRSCFGPDCTPDHVAMLVVDARDPARPQVIGDYAAEDGATLVAVTGNRVLLADSVCRLTIVSVADPGNPGQTGCVSVPVTGQTAGIAASGNTAYVLDTNGALFVVDLAGASGARVVGTRDLGPLGAGVAIAGNIAFAALSTYGLTTVDVTTPTSLRPVSGLRWPTDFIDAVVEGHLAYAAGSPGLHVLDLSAPGPIRQVGALATGDAAFRVVRSGVFAYLLVTQTADPRQPATNLVTVDVTDPSAPAQVDAQARAGLADMVLGGTHLYVTANAGLAVFDLATTPARPALVGQLAAGTGNRFGHVAVSGDRAYVIVQVVGGGGGRQAPVLRVVDVSAPSAPRALGDVTVGDAQSTINGLDARGDHVLLARARAQQEEAGLVVVEVRNPAAPVIVGEWKSLGNDVAPNGIGGSGRWAYLSTWAGVRAMDVIVPGYPDDVAAWNSPELGTTAHLGVIETGDGRLVLPRADAGLIVLGVDLADPPTSTAGPSPTRTPTGAPHPSLTPNGSETPTQIVPGPTRRATPTRGPSATPTPFGTPPPTPPPTRTPWRTPGTRPTLTPARSATPTPFGTPPSTVTPFGTPPPTPTSRMRTPGPEPSITRTPTWPPASPTPTAWFTPGTLPTTPPSATPGQGTAPWVPTPVPGSGTPSATASPVVPPTAGPSPTAQWWSTRIYLSYLLRQRWGD